MGNYRNVSVSFWTDSKIDDDFTPEDKYFYLYLLTNPHASICGCYEISMKQMERETGCTTETVMRLLNRMENIHRVLRYSPDTKEILLLNWFKYNWTRSEKLKKAVQAVLPFVKNEEFRRFLYKKAEEKFGEKPDGNKRNSARIKKQTQDEDKDTDTDADKDEDKDKDKDVSIPYQYGIDTVSVPSFPPTREEIASYIREKQYSFTADRFFNWYQAKGWKIHGDIITDWKAAADNWAANQRSEPQHRDSAMSAYDRGETSINPRDLELLTMFND